MTTAALPADGFSGVTSGADSLLMTTPANPESGTVAVTGRQREYLDALRDAGVHPSNDLVALSIGSYICQAHGAGQSDQAVRDFVLPMVRGDLHDEQPGIAATSMASQVDDATAAYLRIATDRLC